MDTDPYRSPEARVADPPAGAFRWMPALAGGATGIGAAYSAGIILSPVFQHWHTAHGVGIGDLYSVIAQSLAGNAAGHAVTFLGETLGGITAAQLAGTKPFAHALASAAVPYIVLVASHLGVFPSPFPLWSQLLGFLSPVPCALLGAWLYTTRNTRL
jgi:hypothetical protein